MNASTHTLRVHTHTPWMYTGKHVCAHGHAHTGALEEIIRSIPSFTAGMWKPREVTDSCRSP